MSRPRHFGLRGNGWPSVVAFRDGGYAPATEAAERRSRSAWALVQWLAWSGCAVAAVLCLYAWGALVDLQREIDDERVAWHKGYTAGVQACPPDAVQMVREDQAAPSRRQARKERAR